MEQFWLAFTRIKGLGPIRLRELRSHFASIEQAWFADSVTLRELGMPQVVVENHALLRQQLDPHTLLAQVTRLDAWVLTLDNPAYPPLLREIDDAPVVLYGRGDLLPADDLALAVIGTRRASGYGKEMTRQLVGGLVAQGVTVVSGLARGIDAAAHQTALDCGGRTIAVLGSGIDIVYPSEHRELAKAIVHSGALLTEYAPGVEPLGVHFPARNRIISGMTLGTVIVEAPDKSGSIGTANLAGEQGREVFAVPGNANSNNSRGTNRLIQDGAKLVLDADDILKELQIAHRAAETRQVVNKLVPANAQEQMLCDLLHEPLHVDEVCRRCGLSIKEVNAALALMELKGLVYQTAPMTYHTVR